MLLLLFKAEPTSVRVEICTVASLMWDQAGKQKTSVAQVQTFTPLHREAFLHFALHFVGLSCDKH